MNKKILEDILMKDDVVSSIRDNFDVLINLIPEIKDMVGFEHKHPQHHLDVFEHTLLALSMSVKDFEIRLVLLLHDIGKPHSCQEGEIRHFKNHPAVSREISAVVLKRLGFEGEEFEELCYLIEVHDNLIEDDYLADKRFKIQFCDSLAHHPSTLEKRIKYLLEMNAKINGGKEKEEYENKLNFLLSNMEVK